MKNVPPPNPNSSPIGMDEWIGIIVAFTTIGAILISILGQKDKGFELIKLKTDSHTKQTNQTGAAPQLEISPTREIPSVLETSPEKESVKEPVKGKSS